MNAVRAPRASGEMPHTRRRVAAPLVLALLLLAPLESSGYQRITQGSTSLYWSSLPVRFLLQSAGSDDIGDESEFLACRQAFQAWQDVAGSAIAFEEDTTSDADRTDYAASDIHLVWFDETDASGFFPGASATIAVTPITYSVALGIILDADIIFNGDDQAFSTDKSSGTFDVQSIATHEAGHFLGLDHAACLSATMYPYAEAARTTARSLSADDAAGASAIYPAGGATASISGSVNRTSNSTAVAGASVVAVGSDGVVATTTLSATNGTFTLAQLPAGTYLVYAEPLDGPVASNNFSSSIASGMAIDFALTFLGGNPSPTSVALSSGQAASVGTIGVGAAAAQNLEVAFDYPYTIVRGTTPSVIVLGEGMQATDTVTISGSDVTVTSKTFLVFGGLRGFSVTLNVPANAVLGPRNIYTTASGGTIATLTGVVEVSQAAPSISSISPASGMTAGGEAFSVNGSGLQSGATITIGDALASGAVWVSAARIDALTPPGSAGAKSVIVQNPDGQVAVLAGGYTYFSDPSIAAVNPPAGSALGGTQVLISGSGFAAGLTIEFDGAAAAAVQSVTATAIECTTPPGALGAADLVVTNPGGFSDTLAGGFTYVSGADPVASGVSPASGSTAGGTTVTISGSNFAQGSAVIFGQAADGSGGSAASSVNVVSATQITAVTPAFAAGTVAVTVESPSGASSRLASAFTYIQAGGGGGGGGCLSFAPPRGAPTDSAALFGALLPYLLLVLVAAARSLPLSALKSPALAAQDAASLRKVSPRSS